MWDPKNPNKLSPDIIEKLRPIIKEQDKTLKGVKQPETFDPVIKQSDQTMKKALGYHDDTVDLMNPVIKDSMNNN